MKPHAKLFQLSLVLVLQVSDQDRNLSIYPAKVYFEEESNEIGKMSSIS